MLLATVALTEGGSNLGEFATHFSPPVLVGQVTDSSRNPVSGASVVTLSGHSTMTDAAGNYTLVLDATGVYSIRVQSAEGSSKGRVQVNVGVTTTQDFSLKTERSFPFFQGQGATYTGFAVSNFSDRAANLQFSAFDSGGQLAPFPTNPARFELAPQNQLARLGSEIFGVDPQSLRSGWVELTSDNPQVGSFFLSGSDVRLDGSVAFARQAQKFYFTRVHEGGSGFRGRPATTFLSLANPNDHAISFKLHLRGSQNLEKQQSLPAKGFLYQSVSELFGSSLSESDAYLEVEVTEGDGAVGVEFIELAAGRTIAGLNALEESSATELFSAQMANGEVAPGAAFFTDLRLLNTGTQARQATVEVIGADGTPLAGAVTVQLEAGGRFQRDVGEMFGLGPNTAPPASVGSIRVRADGPGIKGDVVFGDPVSLTFAASMPLQTQLFTEAVFSQVANALGFFTGLAFFNPGTATAEITIEVFSELGARTGTGTVQLESGKRISKLLVELVPETSGQVRGYIRVRSTQPLIAQQVFGDTGGSFLSAVLQRIVR